MRAAILALLLVASSTYAQHEDGPRVKADKNPENAGHANAIAEENDGASPKYKPNSLVIIPLDQAEPSNPNAEYRSDEGTEFWPPLFGYRLKITDTLLVIFTSLLWVSTASLVRGAKDTSKRQLRAYVSADTEVVIINGAAPKTPMHGIVLNNHGQTPANQITHWTRLLVADFPLKAPLDRSEPVDLVIKSVLHPGADRHIIAEKELTPQEMGAIMSDGYAIYFWGDVDYVDVFNNPQRTRFTYFADRDALLIGKWAHYKDGNDAT